MALKHIYFFSIKTSCIPRGKKSDEGKRHRKGKIQGSVRQTEENVVKIPAKKNTVKAFTSSSNWEKINFFCIKSGKKILENNNLFHLNVFLFMCIVLRSSLIGPLPSGCLGCWPLCILLHITKEQLALSEQSEQEGKEECQSLDQLKSWAFVT